MKVTIKCKNGDIKEFKGYVESIQIDEGWQKGDMVKRISIFSPSKCGNYHNTLEDVDEVHITGL